MTQWIWAVVTLTMCVGAVGALSLVRIAGICSKEDERWAHGSTRSATEAERRPPAKARVRQVARLHAHHPDGDREMEMALQKRPDARP